MAEQELEVQHREKNGRVYNNLNLKTRVDKATGGVIQGLTVGNHVKLTKKYNEGLPTTYGYSARALYKGEEVSFLLSNKEHDSFVQAGGVDEEIEAHAEAYEFTQKDGTERKGITIVFKPAQ